MKVSLAYSPGSKFRWMSDKEGKVAQDAPGKDSLAYIQLEKQNERLKEALIKLRIFHTFESG